MVILFCLVFCWILLLQRIFHEPESMDMIETDAKDIINEKNDTDLDHQNRYRNVLRSKILRRIQEKSELFDDSNGDDDVGHRHQQKQESNIGIDSAGRRSNNDDNLVVDDSKINEKVRRQLSNEWRKTLERVLNYRQDYLDDKLVVKRKDSIRFFIQADWPNETEDANDDDQEDDDDDDTNSNKRRRRRKTRKSKHKNQIKKNPNQAIDLPPEFDPDRILVVRMKPSRSGLEPGIERILTESFELEPEWEYDDERLVEKLQQFVHHRCLIRLLRERIDLRGIPVERFVRNFQERYLVQQDPGAMVPWNQDLLLNHLDLANKSKFYKIFMKTLQTILAPTKTMANHEDHMLNNRGWMLSVGMVRMDFQRHPRMEREDRMIKKLTMAYRKYRESISVRSESKLQKLRQQIDLLVAKIDQFQNADDQSNDHHQEEQQNHEREMDLKLLQRLTTQFDQLILARRKSLIKLIEQWSRFQNDLDKYPQHSELNQIDLRLDETTGNGNDEQGEQFQWEQLFEWRLKIETIIIILLNDPHRRPAGDTDPEPDRSNQIKAQVKQSVFLMDGRLPGEPKFKDIELVIPRNVSNHQDHMLNVQYYVEVLIGQRIVATFDPRPLLRRSFEVGWDLYRSFPMPIILSGNDVYRFASTTTTTTTTNNDVDVDEDQEEKDKVQEEEEDYHRRLPRIRIKERNSTTTGMKTTTWKTIAEIRMQGLPLPLMDAKERSMRIRDRINYTDDDDDDNDDDGNSNLKPRKSILEANVEFRAFWQSLPPSSSSSSSAGNEHDTLSERFWLYDETKRKIKRTKDLARIDQWLHDLRYQIMDDLDPVGADFIEDSAGGYSTSIHHHWYQRRIMELMQLLLKQKYQLELMRIFQAKKQRLVVDRLKMAMLDNKPNSDNQRESAVGTSEDDGTFCTDEEIMANKRFQMMLQRSQGQPGLRDYRFMPLTTMDLFLMPDSLTMLHHGAGANMDLGRRSMIEVVWQILRRTCHEHQERLNDDQTGDDDHASTTTTVISHDWCDADNQWFQCVGQVLHQIWTTKSMAQITTHDDDDRNDHQQPLTMVDHDPGIVHYHEIVRESSPLDAVAGLSWLNSWFDWFNPTAPSALVQQLANQRHRHLNPPRKNRHTDAIQPQDALQRDCQVHLLVQQASNVPLKVMKMMSAKKKDGGRSGSGGTTGGLAACSSYVEIQLVDGNETHSFRNQSLQTMSTSVSTGGDQPSWNESFKFKTKIDLRKRILLNLFVVDKSQSSNPSAIHEDDDDDDDSNYHLGDDPLHNHDHSKLERVWLGQLRIPLKTLLFRPRIEGSFPMFTPYFLKSFRSFSNQADDQADGQEDRTTNNRKREEEGGGKFSKNVDKLLANRGSSKDPTELDLGLDAPLQDVRLSVFITTDPLIDSSKNLAPNLNPNSLEPRELIQYCDRWLQPLSKRFPQRRFVCMVDNVQHRSILATRFLAPLKPPDFDQLSPIKLEDLKKSTKKSKKHENKMTRLANQERLYVQLIIRFVSLIPSLLDQPQPPAHGQHQQPQQSSSRFIDQWSSRQIWLDAEQFLTIRLGGQAEHAILLSCFLQYLDKQAYLVLGTGQLDGPAVYVIVYPAASGGQSADDPEQPDREETLEVDTGRNATKFRLILIDPKRGQQFGVQDFHCTLVTVDTIITPDNVYANIQKSNHPSLISYNLKRANHWQPLFTYRTRMNFPTLDLHVQPSSIDYGGGLAVNHQAADRAKNLELKLEQYLREQFMSWRRRLTGTYTAFNRFCGQIIKQRVLPELERHSCLLVGGGQQQQQQQQQQRYFKQKRAEIEAQVRKELQQVYDLHRMLSYPLNIRSGPDGYSAWNFEQISRLIHATQLHQIHFGSPNQVEYVLVCHVHPYPCDLYSIWIWLAALTSKSAV